MHAKIKKFMKTVFNQSKESCQYEPVWVEAYRNDDLPLVFCTRKLFLVIVKEGADYNLCEREKFKCAD